MGVGESAVCRELLRQLTPGVWLDGDWCWNMNPFVVSEENKRMVLSNITHLLRAYLNNSSYRYVLFCWVMDQPLLFEAVLGPLRDIPFTLHSFSLVCTEQVLRERLERMLLDAPVVHIAVAAEHAQRGCGLSWDHWVTLFSSEIDAQASRLPHDQRTQALEIAPVFMIGFNDAQAEAFAAAQAVPVQPIIAAGYQGEAIRQKLGRERQLAIRAVRERWLER